VSNDPTTRLQEHLAKNTSRRHHQSERSGAQLSRAVGIRPQPDQVADEMAIRGLAQTQLFTGRSKLCQPTRSLIPVSTLLTPEESVLIFVDHQAFQFANMHSHEPQQTR
jgi:hypothetical protein